MNNSLKTRQELRARYLERGNEHHLLSSEAQSYGCAVADL
jgi:hypothetical protein